LLLAEHEPFDVRQVGLERGFQQLERAGAHGDSVARAIAAHDGAALG
jgi:hypothetical protein